MTGSLKRIYGVRKIGKSSKTIHRQDILTFDLPLGVCITEHIRKGERILPHPRLGYSETWEMGKSHVHDSHVPCMYHVQPPAIVGQKGRGSSPGKFLEPEHRALENSQGGPFCFTHPLPLVLHKEIEAVSQTGKALSPVG